MKIYINSIEFNTEHRISTVELCALVHINPENASIIRRRHEDTVINISEILELQENDDFHITRNTLTTPDSAQGKFGRSIPESRINITDRIKTKIEPTKEDKPDFENMASNMMGNPRYMGMEEMDTHENIMLGMKRIWNHYVIPEKRLSCALSETCSSLQTKIAELEGENEALRAIVKASIQEGSIDFKSENERLKSELDKAYDEISRIKNGILTADQLRTIDLWNKR